MRHEPGLLTLLAYLIWSEQLRSGNGMQYCESALCTLNNASGAAGRGVLSELACIYGPCASYARAFMQSGLTCMCVRLQGAEVNKTLIPAGRPCCKASDLQVRVRACVLASMYKRTCAHVHVLGQLSSHTSVCACVCAYSCACHSYLS